MNNMKKYKVTLIGQTPLIMRGDDIVFAEKVKRWLKLPENRSLSVAGDDRSPAWTWIGGLYHDTHHVCIPSDNIMTMLREGGAKIPTGKGKETFKKQTQSMIHLDGQQFEFFQNEKQIDFTKIVELEAVNDFSFHMDAVKDMGFELFVKNVKMQKGGTRHIRVRPRFDRWIATGGVTVIDEEMSGISKDILVTILAQAGGLCGLGDWRPSSRSGGVFGKFTSVIETV